MSLDSTAGMSHPGVWGNGYRCFFPDAVFPAKAGIYATPTLRDSRFNSSLRATPTPTREYTDTGCCVDSGESRNDGRDAVIPMGPG